ncbi:MAG TPA: hypothetical protein VES20_07615 [Bryobacteraceae bacterium]|nr:hypothetical protein [Bryobacteraceae bacterium]
MDDVEIRSADEQAHRAQAQFSTLMLESAIQRGLVTQACYRAGRRDAQP